MGLFTELLEAPLEDRGAHLAHELLEPRDVVDRAQRRGQDLVHAEQVVEVGPGEGGYIIYVPKIN